MPTHLSYDFYVSSNKLRIVFKLTSVHVVAEQIQECVCVASTHWIEHDTLTVGFLTYQVYSVAVQCFQDDDMAKLACSEHAVLALSVFSIEIETPLMPYLYSIYSTS